jgi:hypothetical protein
MATAQAQAVGKKWRRRVEEASRIGAAAAAELHKHIEGCCCSAVLVLA